jgi:hypothetical protein
VITRGELPPAFRSRYRHQVAGNLGESEVLGVFVASFFRACVHLNILMGDEVAALGDVKPDEWLPAARFTDAFASLDRRFRNFEPIKERIGIEMMRLWYEFGPGRKIVRRGVDFLHYQTGSEGYHSVVRGPAGQIGAFTLEALDEAGGRARVRSTTPFDRSMERGVLIGGMQVAGDLAYVAVDNAADPDLFEIELH